MATDLAQPPADTLQHARTILTQAKDDGRPYLTEVEETQVEADMARVTELDQQIKGRALFQKVLRAADWFEPNVAHRWAASPRRTRADPWPVRIWSPGRSGG